MATFRIQSTETGHFLISNNMESDGSVVETVPKDEFNPSNNVRILVHFLDLLTRVAWQIFLIDPPIGPVPTPLTGFVQSSKVPGLYVGYKTVSLNKVQPSAPTELRFTCILD
jgi:hypothetical protein